MTTLTETQKKLLPEIRNSLLQNDNAKNRTLVMMIDQFYNNDITTTDLRLLKNFIKSYMLEKKSERLQDEKRKIVSEQKSKERKDKARAKIILGACMMQMGEIYTTNFIFIFILAHVTGVLSARDQKFIFKMYEIGYGSSTAYYVYDGNTRTDYRVTKQENIIEIKDIWGNKKAAAVVIGERSC